MKAIVACKLRWGNTAAIARAIAEGLGPEAQARSPANDALDGLAGADLIVAGSPLFAFRLPTDARLIRGLRDGHSGPDLVQQFAEPSGGGP